MLVARSVALQDAPDDFLEGKISCLRKNSKQLDLPDARRVIKEAVFVITSSKLYCASRKNVREVH